MEDNIVLTQTNSSFFGKVSLILISVLVFLLPIFFIPIGINFVQSSTSIIFTVIVILGFIFWAISNLLKNQIVLFSNKLKSLIIFLIVPIFYLISFVVNGFSKVSFFGYTMDISTVCFIILSFLFLFLTTLTFNTKEKVFYGYIVFIISSILLSLFLIIRLLFGASVLSFGVFSRITDTVLGAFNNISIFFGISLLLSTLSFEMLSLNRFMKILLSISTLLSLFFVVLVGFSSIWYILAIISVFLLIYRFYINKSDFDTGFSIKKFFNLPVLIIVLSIVFIFTNLDGSVASKFGIENVDVRPNVSATYDIAKAAIKENPIFGSGPNSFLLKWLSYKPSSINNTIFWNTDFYYGIGLIPTFMATTGILGLLSWILFLATYLMVGFKNIFIKSGDKFDDYLKISSFFISVFLWIMSVVYIPSVPIFILTIFFSGLFLSQTVFGKDLTNTISFKEKPIVGFVTSLILVASMLVLVYFGFNIYKNSKGIWYFQKSNDALNKGLDFDKSIMYMDKAIKTIPYDVYYRARADISMLKIQALFNSDLSKIDKEEIQKFFNTELSSAIQSALSAKDRNPDNYLNWIYLAKAYGIAVPKNLRIEGAYEGAINSLNEAMKRNPTNPGIDLLMARIEVDNLDNKKAKDYINLAISKKQNYTDAYFLLAQIQISENNIKEAIKSVNTTTIIEPNNPALFLQLGLLYYNNNDFKSAGQAFERAIYISPDYANAKYYLGLVLYKLNEKDKALLVFKDILKTNPDNEELKTIISKIESGKSIFEEESSVKKELPIKEN